MRDCCPDEHGDRAENTCEKNFHKRNDEGLGRSLEVKVGPRQRLAQDTLQNFNVKSLDPVFAKQGNLSVLVPGSYSNLHCELPELQL